MKKFFYIVGILVTGIIFAVLYQQINAVSLPNLTMIGLERKFVQKHWLNLEKSDRYKMESKLYRPDAYNSYGLRVLRDIRINGQRPSLPKDEEILLIYSLSKEIEFEYPVDLYQPIFLERTRNGARYTYYFRVHSETLDSKYFRINSVKTKKKETRF